MNKVSFIFAAIIILFLGCNLDSGGSDDDEAVISGTIIATDLSSVVIGTFSSSSLFFGTSGSDEISYDLYDGTGPFTPLGTETPDSDGEYEIDLPEDAEDLGNVVAWVDSDADGLFDFGTETGYLPMKDIDGTEHVMKFGYTELYGDPSYIVGYFRDSDNTNYYQELSTVGTDGYKFYVD